MELKDLDLSFSTKQYIEQVRKNAKRYTNEEEKRLILEAQSGNQNAFNELVNSKLYIVVNAALRFSRLHMDFEELVQEGSIKLINYIKNYDINNKDRITEYLTIRINASMRQFFVKKNYGACRNEKEVAAYKVYKKYYDYINNHGEEPSDLKIAQELVFDIEKVKHIKNHKINIESLEELGKFEKSEDRCDYIYVADEYLQETIYDNEFINTFKLCLNELPEAERIAIEYHLGLIDGIPYSFPEIKSILEISPQAIQAKYAKGMEKIIRKLKIIVPEYYEEYSLKRKKDYKRLIFKR